MLEIIVCLVWEGEVIGKVFIISFKLGNVDFWIVVGIVLDVSY